VFEKELNETPLTSTTYKMMQKNNGKFLKSKSARKINRYKSIETDETISHAAKYIEFYFALRGTDYRMQ